MIRRTGRHTPTKNSLEYTPGSACTALRFLVDLLFLLSFLLFSFAFDLNHRNSFRHTFVDPVSNCNLEVG